MFQISGTEQPLLGVHFIDKEEGWAVGNKGVIIHTRDGGKTWVSQDSGAIDPFLDVYFIDSKRGWAVGFGPIARTEDGGKIRLRGQGEAGTAGGPPGDLIIAVNVRGHRFFTRSGAHIYCDVKINLKQAVLGTKIKVRTMDGKHAVLKIPPGTQPGTTFKLKGLGMKKDGVQGDQFVTVNVEIPRNLTPEQKKLYEQLF